MSADMALHQKIISMADLVTPMAVRAAVTLRIADHVGTGQLPLQELARLTATMPRPLEKLLKHLVTLNILSQDGDLYQLTELGAALRRENGRFWPFESLDVEGLMGRTELSAIHLLHTLRTGESVYHGMYGTDLWAHVNEVGNVEDELWSHAVPPGFDIEVVTRHPCWKEARTAVDVGGHTGALAEVLISEYPALRVTVLDLPVFANVAQRRFSAAGTADRATAVGGSFFDPLPEGADVYLLSAILADWDDADAVRLLRNCAQAAGPQGRILVSEVCLSERVRAVDTGMALWLEAVMADPDRTIDDLTALAAEAGLETGRVDEAMTRVALELRVR
ncbi:methyltransferase [Nonomuraea sp. NPDC049141]|uniref:methyltransferase n=1 Tax=Nonomuraea sp. NPDC049141 TaxID=3155500 RepID=UPI0033E59AEF